MYTENKSSVGASCIDSSMDKAPEKFNFTEQKQLKSSRLYKWPSQLMGWWQNADY
jgi:hypothetical protein